MGLQGAAAKVLAPIDAGGNDFRTRRYTVATTHRADPIPDTWCGRFVKLRMLGGNMNYGFSTNSSAEISFNVAATDTGAFETVGDYLGDGDTDHMFVPHVKPGETLYFVREGSASCSVFIRLADSPNQH